MSRWAFAVAALCALCFPPALRAQHAGKPSAPGIAVGSTRNGVYRNPVLGITYKIRYGWVDRTSQIGDETRDTSNGQVLLAVFERPPEAVGDTINSAVTIATESVASFPGLKTAADYFGPVTELTKKMDLEAVSEPYEVTIGPRQLVRKDFKKEIGGLTMYWTSLAMLARGHVVSFTFVGSSEDEMEELIGRLSFGAAGARTKH